MIMAKEKIIEAINAQLPYLKSTYHIKKIGVFGSVVRGEDKEESDIDILVEFDEPIGFFDFIRLETFLAKILQKKVDLISVKALKPAIRDEVFRELVYV